MLSPSELHLIANYLLINMLILCAGLVTIICGH